MENNNFLNKLIFGRKNILVEFRDWMKVVFTSGIWSFFPVLIGVGFGYWLDSHGIGEGEVKGVSEVIAIWLMSLVVFIFLLRSVIYKLPTDIVLLIVGIAFLCREIHFAGTDTGVYVVVAIGGVLAWIWRDNILEELAGKKQLKAGLFCMFWSYLVTLLIQRRVFREHRIGILPNEQTIHITLEEVTEDIAHLMFLLVGIISFFYSVKKIKSIEDAEDVNSSATLTN